MSAESNARTMKQLLPPGWWNLSPDSVLSKVFLAAGDECERVEDRSLVLIEEADPRTTSELLEDWERVLELEAEGTEAERRARIEALMVRRQRVRPVDFQQALGPLLGQAAEDVVVIERGRAFAILVEDDREIYRFFIYRDPDEPGDYDLEGAQAMVDRMAHSHMKGHVIESIDFLCDDEFSLCDRDLLGV